MAIKKCFVDNCDSCSTRKEDVGVTYHKFPKDAKLREIWTEVTRLSSSNIDLPLYVCSRHFRKSDFQSVDDSKYVLKSDAVPSIFPWVSNLIISQDKVSTDMETESDIEKVTSTEKTEDSIFISKDGEYDEESNPPKDKEEVALNDSKDCEGENIESIKKFIEEQEKQILKLEAEVKPSTSKLDLTQNEVKNDTITVAEAKPEISQQPDMKEEVQSNLVVEPGGSEKVVMQQEGEKEKLADESETKSLKKEETKNEKSVKAAGKGNNSMALSVGSKVEAKDFGEIWHPALIAEVDYDEMEVLVHYDNEVKKTDEWINVSSPRLRPYASPSAKDSPETSKLEPVKTEPAAEVTKQVAKVEDKTKKTEYKVGDRCLARWRDNKRFMATVENDFGHGKYEVVFDDGFHWVCNVSRLSRLREPSLDVRLPVLDAPSASTPPPVSTTLPSVPGPYHTHLFDPARDYLGSKSERRERKRKLNIKEIFNIGQKKKREDGAPERKRVRVKVEKKTNKEVQDNSNVSLTVKCEPTTDLPDAVAAIIGTPTEEGEGQETKLEPEPVTEPEVIEVEVLEPKDEVMVVDPTDLDMDEVVKEEEVAIETEIEERKPATAETQPVKPEKIDLKLEAARGLDRIKVSIAKLEVDIVKATSPKHKTEETESKKQDTDSTTPPDKDKKKSQSKVKKAKKLRLLQEKRVKKEVEKVKSELEAMKTQLEEMKKQVGLKTESLYRKSDGLVEDQTQLLPGEWCCKWVNGQPVGTVSELEPCSEKMGLPRRSVQVDDYRLPNGWTKHMVRRSLGSSAGKWDVVLVSPDNRRMHTKSDMRHYLEASRDDSLKPYEPVLMDFGVHRKLSRRLGWDTVSDDMPEPSPLPCGTISLKSPIVKTKKLSLKRKALKTKMPRKHSSKKRKTSYPGFSHALDIETTPEAAQPIYDNPVLEDGYVWVGSLKVQVIDTLLRCPADGCFKNFRNNTLLQMHIKHYHRELRKMMGATPKVSDLAYARTAPVAQGRLRCEGEPRVPKLKINKKRLEETKAELKTPEMPSDFTAPEVLEAKEDSPRLRLALVGNKPVKRPRVLLPVKKTDSPPQTLREAYMEQENNLAESDFVHKTPEHFAVLDFESAISTHTVTKPILPERYASRKKGEKRKKTFATISKVKPASEDEDWYGPNSDFETQSSFPRSGTPDSKLMDSKSAEGTPTAPVSSESTEDQKEPNVYMYTETGERVKIVHMKREEIINCHCGVREEDGLMIQCELCLCWQHALCHNIQKECEVPEKYTCSICLNPRRGRRSQRFLHDQDRLYEGLLPGAKPCENLKRSHELSGNLLRIEDALHALRVKYYVASKKDHPKLYLWAKDWESSELNFTADKLNSDYVDLNVMINEINKENLPLKADDVNNISLSGIRTPPSEEQDVHRDSQLGSQSLLSGLLSSPGAVSMDLPISTSDLERLAKTVQEAAENASRAPMAAPEPEAPIENSTCRENLLRHIQRCQALIDARLDSIEAQVAELESQDPLFEDDETPAFFPRTKQTIQMMLRDLDTMEELGVIT